jgi:hypothetical protein
MVKFGDGRIPRLGDVLQSRDRVAVFLFLWSFACKFGLNDIYEVCCKQRKYYCKRSSAVDGFLVAPSDLF